MRPTLVRVSEPLVLGIESTCDETGVGLVRGTDLLVDRTATSMDEYARYGGIIPEIASRAHLESFLPTLDAALDEAGVALADVDAIAVAAGPGLVYLRRAHMLRSGAVSARATTIAKSGLSPRFRAAGRLSCGQLRVNDCEWRCPGDELLQQDVRV